MIGRNGERRSGISAQTARHDDDDIYIYIYIKHAHTHTHTHTHIYIYISFELGSPIPFLTKPSRLPTAFLGRVKTPHHNECLGYSTKPSGETYSTPLLPLLSGPLVPGVVVFVMVKQN